MIKICDRNAFVFTLDNGASSPNVPDKNVEIPDDFFDFTLDDLQQMLPDLTIKSTNKRKKKTYNVSIIRVIFPDNTGLQGFFSPHDTLEKLYEFVRQSLEDSNLSFYLYTGIPAKPPLEVTNQTLLSAELVPKAKVHFGCRSSPSTYLSQSLQKEIKPISEVDGYLRTIGERLTENRKRRLPSTSHGSNTEPTKFPKLP